MAVTPTKSKVQPEIPATVAKMMIVMLLKQQQKTSGVSTANFSEIFKTRTTKQQKRTSERIDTGLWDPHGSVSLHFVG